MLYCEYCGQKIELENNFCPYCGGPVPVEQVEKARAQAEAAAAASQMAAAQAAAQSAGQTAAREEEAGDHTVVIVSLGTSTKTAAKDTLKKALGYTSSQAKQLLDCLPAAAAHNLSYRQASYLAAALSQKGLEVSLYSSNGAITFDSEEADPVYKKDGSLLETAAMIFGALSGIHKLSSFTTWNKPYYQAGHYHPYGHGFPEQHAPQRPPHPPRDPWGRPGYFPDGPGGHEHYPGGTGGHEHYPGEHGQQEDPRRKSSGEKKRSYVEGFGPGPTHRRPRRAQGSGREGDFFGRHNNT